VRVRVDALPELQIQARITQISPLAELSNDYPLHAQFSRLRRAPESRFTAAAGDERRMDILIDRLPKAIGIPPGGVHAGRQTVVFVAERGAYHAVVVQLLAPQSGRSGVSGDPANAL